jgi:hypothetical protein
MRGVAATSRLDLFGRRRRAAGLILRLDTAVLRIVRRPLGRRLRW